MERLEPPERTGRVDGGVRSDDGWLTRERTLVVVLAVATGFSFYLCAQMTRPFLPALAWALALAVVARPLHEWIAAKITNPDVAAGVTVVLVGALVIVPALFVVHQFASEVTGSIEQTQTDLQSGRWRAAVDRLPWLAPLLRWVDKNLDVQTEIARALQGQVGNFTALLGGSIWSVTQLLLTLFTLFFYFRDRRVILKGVRALVPLSDSEADQVFQRVSDTIHATVYGTLLVALIQGTLGGLMFWWLGLSAPITWGAVMALLAIIPYLGAFVVWVPAAAGLALEGSWGNALLLTAWGLIVVGLIDNLLYPVFVGQRLRLHTLLAFIAIVGGLAVFGTSGLVLGPVILAVTIALIEVWHRRTVGGHAAEEGINAPSSGRTP